MGVLVLVPLLPAHHGRAAQALLQAPGQVLGLDADLEAEQAPHGLRVDLAGHAHAHRPLHHAGRQRRVQRPADLQLAYERANLAMATNDTEIERFSYDVVVIGAGGSGLRAAIEARARGLKTAIISKSLFGKAHTV